jgi:hypothetical protein
MKTFTDEMVPQVKRILRTLERLEGEDYVAALEIVIGKIRKHKQAVSAELETVPQEQRVH